MGEDFPLNTVTHCTPVRTDVDEREAMCSCNLLQPLPVGSDVRDHISWIGGGHPYGSRQQSYRYHQAPEQKLAADPLAILALSISIDAASNTFRGRYGVVS
ncbi:hypothetical protein ACVNHC_22390 [Pannonibacter sp. Q-1]